MPKKITIKVSDEMYNRWKAAAERDERTLNGWIVCRVEGRPAENPQLPKPPEPPTCFIVDDVGELTH